MNTESPSTARPPTLRVAVIVVMVACLVVLIIAIWPRPAGQTQVAEQPAAPQAIEPSNEAASQGQALNIAAPTAAPASIAQLAPAAAATQPEPTPESRQLVAS